MQGKPKYKIVYTFWNGYYYEKCIKEVIGGGDRDSFIDSLLKDTGTEYTEIEWQRYTVSGGCMDSKIVFQKSPEH